MKYILLNNFFIKDTFKLIKDWGKGGQKVGENKRMNDIAEQVHVFQGNFSCTNSRKVL